MINIGKFKQLQALFFSKVVSSCNPSTIKVNFIEVTSHNPFTDFTGDSARNVKTSFELKCFYIRNISEKQREKMGITEDVDSVVYVSPLELRAKIGTDNFPDYVRNSYSQMSIDFLGKHQEIVSIVDLEPMQNGNTFMCLAYQINLKNTTGNTNID